MGDTTQRWTIGDVTLTALVEAETPGVPAQFFYPDSAADDVDSVDWMVDGAAGGDGTITFRVQAFVIERAGRTILVDPCVGNSKQRALPFWNDLTTPWLDRFHAAGFTTDGIDMVVHTHLHSDHIGWDTVMERGEWVPTFANAIHVYVDEELEYAKAEEQRAGDDPYADSIAPILRANLARIVSADAKLGSGLHLQSTPGHTPGHTSLVVQTGADPLVVSGDLLHHPFQLAAPHLAEVADWNPGTAAETRKAFFDEHARAGSVVAGTHFPIAPVGRIEADGPATWRFTTVAP